MKKPFVEWLFLYSGFTPESRCACALHQNTLMNFLSTLVGSIRILFAGLWLVFRIILEYFGIISDGNDRSTGIKDLREEYKKANYR
jgi:hypothetical protein